MVREKPAKPVSKAKPECSRTQTAIVCTGTKIQAMAFLPCDSSASGENCYVVDMLVLKAPRLELVVQSVFLRAR